MTSENPMTRSTRREVDALEVCDLTRESAEQFFQQNVQGTDGWYRWIGDCASMELDQFQEFFGEQFELPLLEGSAESPVARRVMDPDTLRIQEIDGCNDVQMLEFEIDIGYVTAPYVPGLLALPVMQAAGFNLLDIAVMHLDGGGSVFKATYDRGRVTLEGNNALVNVTDDRSPEELQYELLEAREDGRAGTEVDELFEQEISSSVLPAMAGVTFEQLYPAPEDQAEALRATAAKIHDLAEALCTQISKSVEASLDEIETAAYWVDDMAGTQLTSWIDEDELREEIEAGTYSLREGIKLVNAVDATNVGS